MHQAEVELLQHRRRHAAQLLTQPAHRGVGLRRVRLGVNVHSDRRRPEPGGEELHEAVKAVGETERDRAPFTVIACATDATSGRDVEDSDFSLSGIAAVIDCSGTYGLGNSLGAGGAPAEGASGPPSSAKWCSPAAMSTPTTGHSPPPLPAREVARLANESAQSGRPSMKQRI